MPVNYARPNKDFGSGYDWRGTKIEVGDRVICTAKTNGHLSEGEVYGFTPSGMVRVKLTHCSWGNQVKSAYTCSQVTVVTDLPPCNITMTEQEIYDHNTRETKKNADNVKTHMLRDKPGYRPVLQDFPLKPQPLAGWNSFGGNWDTLAYRKATDRFNAEQVAWSNRPCLNCEAKFADLGDAPCGS